MQGCRTHRWLGLGAGLAAMAWSGCGTEPAAGVAPAMPQMTGRAPHPAADATATMAHARERLGRNDVSGAVHAIDALPEHERAAAFRQLGRDTAAKDPARAARLALALPPGDTQDEVLGFATRTRFTRDPRGTVAWAAGLQGRARLVAMDTLAAELTRQDPRAGLAWVLAVPEQPGKLELLQLAAAHWARRDREGALDWAHTLAAGARNRVTTSIAFEVAQTDPAWAATLAPTIPGGRDRWLLLSAIAETWIARDPREALGWVRSLPAGEAKDAAWAGLVSATGPVQTRHSNAVSGTYLTHAQPPGGDITSLSPGLERSDAVRREFEKRLQESPARAAELITTLPPPDVTDEMLRRLAREWFPLDPSAASNWLQLNVPSAARRDQILREALP